MRDLHLFEQLVIACGFRVNKIGLLGQLFLSIFNWFLNLFSIYLLIFDRLKIR